jgi:hypothetical protein
MSRSLLRPCRLLAASCCRTAGWARISVDFRSAKKYNAQLFTTTVDCILGAPMQPHPSVPLWQGPQHAQPATPTPARQVLRKIELVFNVKEFLYAYFEGFRIFGYMIMRVINIMRITRIMNNDKLM